MADKADKRQQEDDAQEKMMFEEALGKLEEMVAQIEAGQISLEESIEKYAEGIKLIQRCRAILETAEKKIEVLTKGPDGSLVVTGELPEEVQQ